MGLGGFNGTYPGLDKTKHVSNMLLAVVKFGTSYFLIFYFSCFYIYIYNTVYIYLYSVLLFCVKGCNGSTFTLCSALIILLTVQGVTQGHLLFTLAVTVGDVEKE